jgi:hypothetical protein
LNGFGGWYETNSIIGCFVCFMFLFCRNKD